MMKYHSVIICVFFFVTLFVKTISVLCVKSCIFCADYTSKCKENDRALERTKMKCHHFAIGKDGRPQEHFGHPEHLNETFNSFLIVSLPHKSLRTVCVSVEYRMKPDFVDAVHKHENASFTLQSCMFRDYAEYNNACDYATNDVLSNFVNHTCKLCTTPDCNGVDTMHLNGVTLFLPLLLVVNIIYMYFK